MPRMKYKHMLPEEVKVWQRFLDTKELALVKVDYDFHLGTAPPTETLLPPELERLWDAISRKRLDVLGETEDAIWLIEVTPRAGMSVLGKLITYETLYRREYSPTKPVELAVVCERVEHETDDVLRDQGIHIFVV